MNAVAALATLDISCREILQVDPLDGHTQVQVRFWLRAKRQVEADTRAATVARVSDYGGDQV